MMQLQLQLSIQVQMKHMSIYIQHNEAKGSSSIVPPPLVRGTIAEGIGCFEGVVGWEVT